MTDNCVSVGIGTECLQMNKEKKRVGYLIYVNNAFRVSKVCHSRRNRKCYMTLSSGV